MNPRLYFDKKTLKKLGDVFVVWITTRYPTKKNISILPMFFLNYIRFLIYFLGGYSIYFNIQIF